VFRGVYPDFHRLGTTNRHGTGDLANVKVGRPDCPVLDGLSAGGLFNLHAASGVGHRTDSVVVGITIVHRGGLHPLG